MNNDTSHDCAPIDKGYASTWVSPYLLASRSHWYSGDSLLKHSSFGDNAE